MWILNSSSLNNQWAKDITKHAEMCGEDIRHESLRNAAKAPRKDIWMATTLSEKDAWSQVNDLTSY